MTKNEFFSKWLETYASDIPNKEIEKYVKATGNYIWHIFSWELLDKSLYLTGEAAKKAYDNIDKSEAVFIDWFEDTEIFRLLHKYIVNSCCCYYSNKRNISFNSRGRS